jgi:predicted RNA-binding protein YlxR (DUF448 family)
LGRGNAQRTCLGCRQVRDQAELVRFVCSPEGVVLVDYRHRLPGRGAYACPERACIDQLLRRRQFDRAFRRECTAGSGEELFETIRKAMLERMENLLGMARKSGQTTAGSNAVLAAFDRSAPPRVVVFAEDVSGGVAEKVERKARHHNAECLHMLDKAILGRLSGRSECSVLALSAGSLVDAFLLEWKRYRRTLGEN